MGIAGSLLVIALSWWMIFFMLLPIGVRSQLEEGNVVPGTEPSAPTAPHLRIKALTALVVALVIWAVLFWLIRSHPISIDDVPIPSGLQWN